MYMIELLLILGLIFVLVLVGLIHIGATVENPIIQDITNSPANPSLNPWFYSVESVLVLNIFYLVINLFS